MDRSKNRNASVIFSYSPRISPALSVHMKFTLLLLSVLRALALSCCLMLKRESIEQDYIK